MQRARASVRRPPAWARREWAVAMVEKRRLCRSGPPRPAPCAPGTGSGGNSEAARPTPWDSGHSVACGNRLRRAWGWRLKIETETQITGRHNGKTRPAACHWHCGGARGGDAGVSDPEYDVKDRCQMHSGQCAPHSTVCDVVDMDGYQRRCLCSGIKSSACLSSPSGVRGVCVRGSRSRVVIWSTELIRDSHAGRACVPRRPCRRGRGRPPGRRPQRLPSRAC